MFNQKRKRKRKDYESGNEIKTKQNKTIHNCTETDSKCERIETKIIIDYHRFI